MDVGSQGKLNIQLEVTKNNFHLKDCIQGVVKFTDIDILLKSMELWIIRK